MSSLSSLGRGAPALTAPVYFAGTLVASILILGAALFYQYVDGLYPCVLCIYQRIPYGAAIALAGVGLLLGARGANPGPGAVVSGLALLCGLGFVAGAGVAAFHVGVEQGWWQGTEACVGVGGDLESIDALRAAVLAAPAVRCDEVVWQFMRISMAGWNFLLSLTLAGVTGLTLWRWLRPSTSTSTSTSTS